MILNIKKEEFYNLVNAQTSILVKKNNIINNIIENQDNKYLEMVIAFL